MKLEGTYSLAADKFFPIEYDFIDRAAGNAKFPKRLRVDVMYISLMRRVWSGSWKRAWRSKVSKETRAKVCPSRKMSWT